MLKPHLLCSFLLLVSFITPAAGAENISLDRLMMLHDILPNESLKFDTELPSLGSTPQEQISNTNNVKRFPLGSIQAPVRVLIDVRSNHSDGEHDFNTLVELAKKRHIEALAFTEHDRYSIRFGLDPVPHILGYSQEHPSLYQTG